jgi:hypothetical protein
MSTLARPYATDPRKIAAQAVDMLPADQDRLRRAVSDMAAQLAELQGWDASPQAGCLIERMSLAETDVLVEFEVEPEAEPAAISVFINGTWCDVGDAAPEGMPGAWAVELQARWKAAADDAAVDAADVEREFA